MLRRATSNSLSTLEDGRAKSRRTNQCKTKSHSIPFDHTQTPQEPLSPFSCTSSTSLTTLSCKDRVVNIEEPHRLESIIIMYDGDVVTFELKGSSIHTVLWPVTDCEEGKERGKS